MANAIMLKNRGGGTLVTEKATIPETATKSPSTILAYLSELGVDMNTAIMMRIITDTGVGVRHTVCILFLQNLKGNVSQICFCNMTSAGNHGWSFTSYTDTAKPMEFYKNSVFEVVYDKGGN